jgi:uncharacterized protein (DUF1499 family)
VRRGAGSRLALLVALLLGAIVGVRLWPPQPGWHEDPATVAAPAAPNHWLMRDGAGAEAPAIRLPLPPDAAAARLAAIAGATPRTTLLADAGGFATWVTRSRIWGFPDTTSVRILPDGGGSLALLYARSRLAGFDWGVSRARAEAWAAALAAP